MTPEHCEVLVVGAGPTGLTLATELARREISTRIVDRAAQRSEETRALGVQARTVELLDRVGVADTAVAQGLPITKFNILSERRQIAAFDLGRLDTPFPFLLMLPQNETEALLEQRLNQLGGAVERGTELAAFEETGDGVRASLTNRDGTSMRVDARYLVGCDGATSTVRDRLRVRFEGHVLEERFAVADLRIEWPLPYDELFAFLHRGNFITFFPMRGRLHRVAIAYTGRDTPDGDVTLTEVQQAVDACGVPGARVAEIKASGRFRINQRAAERESSGRVFLAGDAAHVNSVVGAQGMNIGMQDAFNLGWKLALVTTGRAHERLLGTYPTERARAARRTVRGTGFFTRMTLLHNPVAVMARRRVVPLITSRPTVRTRIEWALSELDISYGARSRPGSARGEPPVPQVGDRVPDIPLSVDRADPTRLFQVIRDDEYSLLLVGEPATSTPDSHAQIRRAIQDYQDVVREHVVAPTDTVQRAYGIEHEAMLLVRPDGYLAFRADRWAADALRDYLREWLIPARQRTDASGRNS